MNNRRYIAPIIHMVYSLWSSSAVCTHPEGTTIDC